MLFRHQDLDIPLVEYDAGGSQAILILREVPAGIRWIDLANVPPFCRPLDAPVHDIVKTSFQIAVYVLMDHADLLSVLLEVDPAMVMEGREIWVSEFPADLMDENAGYPTHDPIDREESSQPVLVHLIIAVRREVQLLAFQQLLRLTVDIRQVNRPPLLGSGEPRS